MKKSDYLLEFVINILIITNRKNDIMKKEQIDKLKELEEYKEYLQSVKRINTYLKNRVTDTDLLQILGDIKELFIVVDMVNGFTREGALADPSILKVVPEQVELMDYFIKRKACIMTISDCHEENSVEFKFFPPHCLKGTYEAELIDELKLYEDFSIKIYKNSTSAIFAKGFLNLLDKIPNLKKVIGCGCLTDVCVPNLFIPLKNYFNENNRDVEIVIPENAIETYDAPNHNREEYGNAAKKLMVQSGIQLVKKYERGNNYEK